MTKREPIKVCKSVGEASELMKAVSNANRLAIVCYLMEKDYSVAEMEDDLGIEQPTLSQQLTYLRDAGIISPRRHAKNMIYTIRDDRIRAVFHALRGVFSGLDDVTSRRRSGMSDEVAIEDSMFD